MDKETDEIIGIISYIKETVERLDDQMVAKAEFADAFEKLDNRLAAMESKIAGIHTRIDGETVRTKNLENRIRTIFPDLPQAPMPL